METFFLILLIILMMLALGSGFPVAFALPGSAIIAITLAGVSGYIFTGNSHSFFIQDGPFEWISSAITNFRGTYWEVERDTLIAIPLFIFMGLMLQRSKIAEELLITMGQLFGRIPGGLGVSVVLVGGLLAATTGIVGATVIAMGLISLPAMLRNKYETTLATGIITASGTLGQVIPPSIVLIIIADQLSNASDVANGLRINDYKNFVGTGSMPSDLSVTSTSAGEMFLGSLIPGLILVGLYVVYVLVYSFLKPKSAPPLKIEGSLDYNFFKKVFFALVPPLLLIVLVLGSILFGIATVNQAGSVGAVGATIMAGYKLAPNQKHTYTPAVIATVSAIVILILSKIFNLNIKLISSNYDLIGILLAFVAVGFLIFAIGWSFYRTFKIDNILKEVSSETTITTTMVFIILIGAAMLTAAFRGFGGEELVRHGLTQLPGGFWTQFIVVMLVIFILGFFIDYLEIAIVVVPIVTPILLADPSANITALWLGVMIGLNMQTSFLTPPFGFSLFYLRGVAPKTVSTSQIWKGAGPFIAIQILALCIIGFYPSLANYLPLRTYLTSEVSPPPTNPKLQECILDYKFRVYENKQAEIVSAINQFKAVNYEFLPTEKKELLNQHFTLVSTALELIPKVKDTRTNLEEYSKSYYQVHLDVRKIQSQVLNNKKKIKSLEDDVRIIENNDPVKASELRNEIERFKLDIISLEKTIPNNWASLNNDYQEKYDSYAQLLNDYYKNADDGYKILKDLKIEIENTKSVESLISIADNILLNLDKLESTQISAKLDELLNKSDATPNIGQVSDLVYEATTKPDDLPKVKLLLEEVKSYLDENIKWKKIASTNLISHLEVYDNNIKDSIGIRSQDRLNKDQAIDVAKCNANHKNIALRF
ncbi:MAG: TRAP transporter large permease subunit [Pelagibacteraceae bacterium]